MTAALKTALRKACAELRWARQLNSTMPDAQIEQWERLADEAEQPAGDRDIKPENVTRTAADIRAEIYGMPPYSGPGLKHGPGGTGRSGPCDADCRKCELEAEIDALQEAQEQREPAGFDRLQASLVAPVSLRLFADAPIPGHATFCCARLGGVWCTEPDGHAGPCRGPEELEIASGEYGPGRRR